MPGLYVSGWLKRGPTGVIAATMYDANETADAIMEDMESLKMKEIIGDDVSCLLLDRGIRPISFRDWQMIDEEEKKLGAAVGKSRVKFQSTHSILSFLKNT